MQWRGKKDGRRGEEGMKMERRGKKKCRKEEGRKERMDEIRNGGKKEGRRGEEGKKGG